MRTRVRGRSGSDAFSLRSCHGLCGAAEVIVYTESPTHQAAILECRAVSISFAPCAELSREDISLWRELQLPDLHFEFRAED